MISQLAHQREEHIRDLLLATGRLRSALRTINIGEGIEGCNQPVQVCREVAQHAIQDMQDTLTQLAKTL